MPSGGLPPIEVAGWSVDSRTIAPGELFFAISGPNHDGHEFVRDALDRGAAAAVVERPVAAEGAVLQTPGTLEALAKLARWARVRWGGRLVAITGSAGKTTTKEIIARLLGTRMTVGRSAGNLNNHIGLPLSILRLPADARAAVVEIGMNHAGEIRRLAALASPDIGVVTNVGHAHVEHFASIEDVALAKRELVESLPPQGVAVLNADDPRVAGFRDAHAGRSITFGLARWADVRAEEVEQRADGVRFRVGEVRFECPLAGLHGVLNVLAGLAVAGLFGLEPGSLRKEISQLEAGEGRGRRMVHRAVAIFDDCYNANPEAVRGMLDLLALEPAGRRLAVIGEMLELGEMSGALHREVGRYAAGRGVDLLVGIHGAAREMLKGAVDAGMPPDSVFFFDDPSEAGEFLRERTRPGDAVLFKGSRGTRVELAMNTYMR
ncbi:MAG: UDP-N-acetylmuramoyl-tripeptide--D-alanyl-D-alanine ligase [Bryobacterales bacterium]|nr:UDP-N-acetylmuramoyl-tripeptide--D-alanyl-D-alanine ligase [Bryobacterales bacterium]